MIIEAPARRYGAAGLTPARGRGNVIEVGWPSKQFAIVTDEVDGYDMPGWTLLHVGRCDADPLTAALTS